MTATISTSHSSLRAVPDPQSDGQAVFPDSSTPQAPVPTPPRVEPTQFGVARTHRDVMDCWRLVYNCYSQKGLIDTNPYAIHTSTQAVNPNTAVIYGRTNGHIDTTLSVIPDGPHSLPLDYVYPQTLDHLRCQGRRLVEVGLLADARTQIGKSRDQAFDTMRLGMYRALYMQSDIVIGVHPRHTEFYVRMMGFEVIGQLSSHPTVNNRPVVPMLLEMSRMNLKPLPRLLRYIKNNPVEASVFDDRFDFGKASMAQSTIGRYLNSASKAKKFRRFNETTDAQMPMQQAAML